MPRIGSASIQGDSENEITPETVLNIGKTVGTQYRSVTVGRNLSPSSMMIFSSLVAGLMSTGASVRDAGVLPSPVIPYAAQGTDCSIIVGNPDDRDRISGLTFWNTDGRCFSETQMIALSNRFKEPKQLANYKDTGNFKPFTGSIEVYKRKVAEFTGSADCQVIMDCSPDCTALVAPQIMTMIGVDAITVNCRTVWDCADWSPNPTEVELKSLSKIVKANYGSIGIALNGDGSRVGIIDENSNQIGSTALLQLLVNYLEPKSIAVPIDTTMGIQRAMNGNVTYCKVGSHNIGECVKSNELDYGGGSDGSFVFPKISYSTDGMATATIIAKMATEASLGDMVDELPTYHRITESIRYLDGRANIAKRLSAKIGEMEYDGLCEIDGWRVEMEGGWFLIRFSDDDTVIDVIAEGEDKMYSAGLLEIAKEAINSSLKSVSI